MKHIKSMADYVSNINEGINYNDTVDADLYDVGFTVLSAQIKDISKIEKMNDNEVEKAAIDAMAKAKPVKLTGKAKTDVAALVKYIADSFKKCGVDLDTANTEIDSSNFANELMIPVANTEFYFNLMVDYGEMAYNGSDFTIGGVFASEDMGSLDYMINDLSNQGDVTKACNGFKQFMKTQK
jgi:hypothetical protein